MTEMIALHDDDIPVRVTGAPGYEDFDGTLLMWPPDDWPVRMAVVGFEWEGEREVAVVPTSCVSRVVEGES